jgi:hypothetical protein
MRGGRTLANVDAREFADAWIAAWNLHDVESILSHYSEVVTLRSPVAEKLMGAEFGLIEGKDALRAYFTRGLELFPNLTFKLIDVMQGLSSIILYYENQRGTRTGEFMEFDDEGKVLRVVANYTL